MLEPVPHKAELERGQLEMSLQLAESAFGSAKEIKVKKVTIHGDDNAQDVTISEHDGTPVAIMSLHLALDPNGQTSTPAGMDLICQGEAMVSGKKAKVVLFRDKPAAG